jgi:hypothetical protein
MNHILCVAAILLGALVPLISFRILSHARCCWARTTPRPDKARGAWPRSPLGDAALRVRTKSLAPHHLVAGTPVGLVRNGGLVTWCCAIQN